MEKLKAGNFYVGKIINEWIFQCSADCDNISPCRVPVGVYKRLYGAFNVTTNPTTLYVSDVREATEEEIEAHFPFLSAPYQIF